MMRRQISRLFLVGAMLGLAACQVLAEPGDERILEARDAASAGNIARLQSLAAQRSNHVLDAYVDYWLLSARVARISEPNPVEAVMHFLNEQEGSYLAERLRSEWAKRLAREGAWALFDQQYARLQQADQELQCYALQRTSSANALESQWLTLTDTPESCAPLLRALMTSGRMKDEDGWWRFRRLVEARRLSGARDVAEWLGEDATALAGILDNPVRYLATAAGKNTATRMRRELIMAAIVRRSRSDVRDAIARWRGLESKGFRSDERNYVWGQLGWPAAQAHLPEAAGWLKRAEGQPMSDEQRAWLVRASLRSGDWRGVRSAIEAMPPSLRERPEWTYWLARAQIELGNSKEASALLRRYAGEAHFYGILSAEAIGQHFVWPPAAQPATLPEMDQVKAMPDLQRALALIRLDMRIEGVREWIWALRDASDRQLLAAAEYARREGLYDRAINTAERTKTEHDFSLRYLAPYYETFSAQARSQNVDLAWVFGLVRQESRFYHVARSGVGAQGLMQIMPATGKWLAKHLGERDYHPGWLTDIDRNVQFGTAYLRHVLDDLGGHPVLASAAYNAGPGRARRWRDSRVLEGAIYAETIPFTETRDYVKKVMANAVIYATLFDGKSARLSDRLGSIPAGVGPVASSD